MIERVKGWLADWRITLVLVGGALVVGTQWGSCTFQPEVTQEESAVEAPAEAAAAKKRLAPPKRKFMDLFLDDNDVNEKAIIGFIAFFMLIVFAGCDLITAFWGQDLVIVTPYSQVS